uniref:Reverse transcriptase zinc-binding domain-containing protein n=1 Tax=Brassica oleracea var. oleracea TaxID=109376 RepID=A0A0D3D612_BRAOL
MVQSLAISSTHRHDTFCWSYTKNGQYTVKSGYLVATNLMRDEEDIEVLQPSITKLQAFAWKVNAPQKICHFIWQLISGKVAVTRNLVRRNMRCDNYCPRCGVPEETVTHAIFESRNDKLFRGIDRDPLELVRYAESECQAWYNARDTAPVPPQDTLGKIQLMGSRNLRRRKTTLHSELEALQWAMESMIQHSTCQRFGTDCKDLIAMIEQPQAWSNYSTELEIIQTLRLYFSDSKISYFPMTQNEIADSLAMTAHSFHRSLCFIGCSIPVWLPRPPQV